MTAVVPKPDLHLGLHSTQARWLDDFLQSACGRAQDPQVDETKELAGRWLLRPAGGKVLPREYFVIFPAAGSQNTLS
jgi:hypothetical protein